MCSLLVSFLSFPLCPSLSPLISFYLTRMFWTGFHSARWQEHRYSRVVWTSFRRNQIHKSQNVLAIHYRLRSPTLLERANWYLSSDCPWSWYIPPIFVISVIYWASTRNSLFSHHLLFRKFILRLIPIQKVCEANLPAIETAITSLLQEKLAGAEWEGKTVLKSLCFGCKWLSFLIYS